MKQPITERLIDQAKLYVFDLLNTKISKNLCYHSIHHTQDVLNNAELIASHTDLSQEEYKILRFSALFHDVGFIEIYKGHEAISARFANKFLTDNQVDENNIKKVTAAILATKVPQNPHDLVSRVLCDADLMYLSDKDIFLKDIELLRQEWKNCGLGEYSKDEFYKITLKFFKEHHYHTEYGKQVLTPRKNDLEKMLLTMTGSKIKND